MDYEYMLIIYIQDHSISVSFFLGGGHRGQRGINLGN